MKLKNRKALLPLLLISLGVLLVLTFSTGGASVDSDSIVYFPITMDFADQLYRDTFDNPKSGWPVDEYDSTRWSYQNNEYEMLIHVEGQAAGARAPFLGLDANSSYSVKAEMRRLQGNESDYFIVFDQVDWDNFYLLAVDPGKQKYGVVKVVKGSITGVIPSTYTAVIKADKATNHLQVDRKGDEIVVTINGQQLATANSSGFGVNPRVGLFMEADDDAPASVRYDNFEVWRLENGAVQSVEMQQGEGFSAGGLDSYSGLMGKGAELFE